MATNYTGNATPTLNNAPANSWATDAEKRSHVGNTYLVTGSGGTAGNVYAFEKYPSAVVKEVPASGLPAEIVTITDGGENLPMTSAEVSLSPIQDLNGYDSPWPGGGGVNKLPKLTAGTYENNGGKIVVDSNGTATFSGTTTAAGNVAIIPLETPITVTEQWYVQLHNSSVMPQVAANFESSSYVSVVAPALSSVNRIDQITSSNVGKVVNQVRFYIPSGVTLSGTFSPMFTEDSTPTAYSPYSNICPISGHTGAELIRTGKNLSAVEELPQTPYWGYSSAELVDLINLLPLGTYTISHKAKIVTLPSNNIVQHGRFYITAVVNGSQVPVTNYSYTQDTSPSVGKVYEDSGTFAITEENRGNINHVYAYCDSSIHTGTGRGTYEIYDIQLELGSTATSYEPYQGDTYSVTFSDQGTVYGGTYDFVSGKLTATHANIASYNGETLPGAWISDRDVYAAGTTPTTGAQVVYELATPIEYTLSTQQLTTLLGENNVWSDAGEISKLVYRSNQYVMAYDWFETWTMPKITRNNGNIIVLPYPQEYTPEIYDVDASTTGRNAAGTMVRDRVAKKHKFNYKFPPLGQADATEILNAVQDSSFTLTTASPETGAKTNYRVYVGDRSLPVYWMPNHNQNSWLYETVTMNLIEM